MKAASAEASFRTDILAGLTAAAIVLPKAMAYATVSGLPVSVGLYTASVCLVIYALLGTSRVLSVTSTTTLAILTGSQLALASYPNAAQLASAVASLTVMVGLVLWLGAFMRLGFVASFISLPVLTGFKAGIGVVIIFDQVPKLLGLHIDKQGFFRDLLSLVSHLPQTSLPTLAVAAATLLALFGAERVWPHSPAPLFVVAASVAASWYWGLESLGVTIVGTVPQGLPELTLPDPELMRGFVPAAMGLALMSFTESIAAGRAFAHPSDPPIDPNRELKALGTANIVGAFAGGMPAGGGTSQTAVVRSAGGRSQIASLATAAAALATMLVLAPILGLLPNATLAAVVIVYSVGLIQVNEFRAIRRVRVMEFGWAVIACLGVLFFGTLQGIVVAIIVSMLGLAKQASLPPVHVIGRKRGADVLRPLSPEHPDDETFEGLLILRPEGRLFFSNAQYFVDQVQRLAEQNQPRVLALDLSRVTDLEYTMLQVLLEGEKRLSDRGLEVWMAGMSPGVLEVARRSGLAEQLGDRMLFNSRAVIARFQSLSPGPVPNDDPPTGPPSSSSRV